MEDRKDKPYKYQHKMNRNMLIATMKDKLVETIYCKYPKKRKILFD